MAPLAAYSVVLFLLRNKSNKNNKSNK